MALVVNDTFTDTAGVALTSHTGETGATWTAHPNQTTQSYVITDANRVRAGGSSTGVALAYASGTPVSADYTVECDLLVKSLLAGSSIGVFARLDTAAVNGYHLRYDVQNTRWQLLKYVTGTGTVIATDVTTTLTVGQTYHIKLKCTGTTIEGFVDGVLTHTATDSAVTAAGKAGLRGGGALAGNTTGLHVDNFQAGGLTPSNTVAPVVSGTRIVGSTLTSTTGTWSDSPSSYSYNWLRDGVTIDATDQNTYVAQTADVGHAVSCAVTATNGAGASSPASSNALSIVAAMVAADLQWWSAAGSGLGGSPGVQVASPLDVFDTVTDPEAVAGDIEYRAVYLKNTHAVSSSTSTVVYVLTQTSSATTDIALAVAVEAAGSDVTAIANESTAPATVTFSAPSTSGAGLSVGTLAPGQARGVWLRWTVIAGTAATGTDSATVRAEGTPT
jgi:hypothetical protein